MLKKLIAKKKLIPVVIFVGAVFIAAGILLFFGPFEAQLASQPMDWTQKTGEGIFAPACSSSSPVSFCDGTQAKATISWTVSPHVPRYEEVGLFYGEGGWADISLSDGRSANNQPMAGSITFNVNDSTSYTYNIVWSGHLISCEYRWDVYGCWWDGYGAFDSTSGNFSSPLCAVGAIQLRETLDGIPRQALDNIVMGYKYNGQPQPDYNGPIPADLSGLPAGEYDVRYKSGGPPGANFQNITPSTTQTLGVGGTITFTFNFTSPLLLPGPFTLSEGTVACNSVPLSWTASTGADAYRILRGSPRVDISPYQPYIALNYTDTTVSQNTTYQYQIEAYNSAGTNRSNEKSITTPFCPPDVRFWPDRTNIYQGQSVTLNWQIYNDVRSCAASSNPTQNDWNSSTFIQVPSGNKAVLPSPPPTVTYMLSCIGRGGTGTAPPIVINISPLALPGWREIIPR